MAMGFLDDVASVGHCISKRIYAGEEHCDDGDYMSSCNTQQYCFRHMASCSCWLLYNRLLHGGYIAHSGLSVGYQKELYIAMAEAITL